MSNLIALETYPQENYEDDNFQDTHLTSFTILEENLVNLLQTNDWEFITVANFLKEWTWDTAQFIYNEANTLNYISSQKIINRQ